MPLDLFKTCTPRIIQKTQSTLFFHFNSPPVLSQSPTNVSGFRSSGYTDHKATLIYRWRTVVFRNQQISSSSRHQIVVFLVTQDHVLSLYQSLSSFFILLFHFPAFCSCSASREEGAEKETTIDYTIFSQPIFSDT